MKLTNKHNLPKTIVNALNRDDYNMGNARMSVTGLLKPPRIGLLYKKHSPDIEKDVSDLIWSLMGKAVHKILEIGGDEEHIPEERLFAEVRGWRISGQLDLQRLGGNAAKIIDYKNTSAWAVMHEKKDWEEQLNVYRWLLTTATDMEVSELAICAFIRDWSRHKAKENPDYPEAPTKMLDVPLWGMKEAAEFVENRVRIHQEAQAAWDMGDEPPLCTDDERWMRTPTYAVIKEGNKRASRTFDDPVSAAEYAANRGASFVVHTRGAEPIRCSGDYCSVSRWCSQWSEWKRDNTKHE